ncbi:hypothetical protein Nepgr_017888 [Nepenthes gracilis]|uniref:Retrotransposon gag domain-containing protein n=1 Tax=Nepenthes gracilis TaxID=150966 RepID=A0AAD3XSK1_NEPGR|nr:hypothetical protein Nepgr_017888 [Nepenthes gracilis]
MVVPILASRRGGKRKKKSDKKPRRPTYTQIPESSRASSQIRFEEHSGSMSPEKSLERGNPRYSRVEIRNPVQEGTSGTIRSIGGNSRTATGHSKEGTELRTYLNYKRSAIVARANLRLEKIWNRIFKDDEYAIDLDRSPFIVEILNRPMPTKFKMVPLDSYDGSTNLIDHLDYFRTHLSVQGLKDPTMYRCFPLALKGDTCIWFHHLPLNSIRSFRELTDLFLAQYTSSQVRRIPRLTEEIKLGSFISPLMYGNFFRHLAHKNLQTFREAESITRAYAAVEEANETKILERTEQSRSFPREGKRKFNSGDHFYQKHHWGRPQERKGYGPIGLTLLTDTCLNILMQIRREKFLK